MLRLRAANLLLGATLSFSDSNNFHCLAHTDNIYFSVSLAFLKKKNPIITVAVNYDTSSLRYVYSRLDRTLKVINVFIVHCGSQTKENAMMYFLSGLTFNYSINWSYAVCRFNFLCNKLQIILTFSDL